MACCIFLAMITSRMMAGWLGWNAAFVAAAGWARD
jgi:hypothetical protein